MECDQMDTIDVKYYERFPSVLRNAFLSGIVCFSATLKQRYENLIVYRGVKYTKSKTFIDKNDFRSNIERKMRNPFVTAYEDKIESYSCSCYLNIDEMKMYAKFPRKNKAIAKGLIKQEDGPIDIDDDTSHVNLYLFENVDLSDRFEVVEI